MANQHYSFQSNWNIAASSETVWQTLTATPFSWSDWWPQLNDVVIIKQTPNLVGTVFTCTWRAPVGYKLHSRITFSDVRRLEAVRLEAAGDLVGVVTCRLSEQAGETHVAVDWQVETSRPWMNYLSFILRPVFVWSHHAVMRSGEKGLQRYLRNQIKTPAI